MLLELLLLVVALVAFMYYRMSRKLGSLKAMGIEEAPTAFPFGSEVSKNVRIGN